MLSEGAVYNNDAPPELLVWRGVMFGRGEKTRTSDLHVPNVARCQLCYTPSAFNFDRKDKTFS